MSESKWPDWSRLSDPVKRVLNQAQTIADHFKQPRPTAAHIMYALTHMFSKRVLRLVFAFKLDDLNAVIKDHLLADDSLAGVDQVLQDALALSANQTVGLDALITAAAQACGFPKRPAGEEPPPREPEEETTSGIELDEEEEGDVPKWMSREKEDEAPAVSPPLSAFLSKFGRDLTALAGEGRLHQIIGRDREIGLVVETLCRVFKRNPLLIGPAGVGKTAIIEGLAQKIASRAVAAPLRGKRIYELSMAAVLAGTKYRGEFEERVTQIIQELKNSNVILFIDEFHSLMGAGITEGTTLDASTMFLPALARGEISCIGATTDALYHKHVVKNKALERRFQPIRVEELSPEETLNMLATLVPVKFEKPNALQMDRRIFPEVIELSRRYMRNRFFPDKAIDILDHAVGRAVRTGKRVIGIEDIKEQIGSLTGLPIGKLEDELRNKLQGLSAFLKGRILGQDHVIDMVVDVIWPKTMGADLHPERPNGVFLFAGPSGVGKTEMAKALAEFLFGSRDRLIRMDMSEYAEPHAVAKLLGAPFGYLGSNEGSPLLNEIEEKPFSILLLDEIEKAHREIHKLFLQVFDNGVLTDTYRRHTYFSDVIIIMTSNISVERTRSIGFGPDEADQDVRGRLLKYFPSEFINRIDTVGLFNPITPETAERILRQTIIPLLQKKWRSQGIDLAFTPEAVSWLAGRGYSRKWGARNLERTADELISTVLAKRAPEPGQGRRERVEIGIKDGALVFGK